MGHGGGLCRPRGRLAEPRSHGGAASGARGRYGASVGEGHRPGRRGRLTLCTGAGPERRRDERRQSRDLPVERNRTTRDPIMPRSCDDARKDAGATRAFRATRGRSCREWSRGEPVAPGSWIPVVIDSAGAGLLAGRATSLDFNSAPCDGAHRGLATYGTFWSALGTRCAIRGSQLRENA